MLFCIDFFCGKDAREYKCIRNGAFTMTASVVWQYVFVRVRIKRRLARSPKLTAQNLSPAGRCMTLDLPIEAMRRTRDLDRILCECELEPLQRLVAELELRHAVAIQQQPSVCLCMIPAEDSLEKQKFYLGEALTTECVVLVDQLTGYGLCLGDEPLRAYCIAVLDALLYSRTLVSPEIETFLSEQEHHISRRQQEEFDLILQTQVDFKLMEEK
jgi:phosphonate C-P lyase system protein PhnG